MEMSGETNFWAAGIKDCSMRCRTRRGVKAEHSKCGPWWQIEKQTQKSELTTPWQLEMLTACWDRARHGNARRARLT